MLYIVGTAIGNIEDTSLRAARTLAKSSIILAEDTRTFHTYYKRVLELFDLKPDKSQQVIHFHKKNEFEKTPEIINLLKNDHTVSLVSESGLPLVADPGRILIQEVISQSLSFTVVPGPSAFTAAAILSGFPVNEILFLGFLPKKKSSIITIFNQLISSPFKKIEPTLVFYESPHRISETLTILAEITPDAKVAVCREITKKFEEITRGKPTSLLHKKFKGEITVVMRFNT